MFKMFNLRYILILGCSICFHWEKLRYNMYIHSKKS